MRLFNDFKHCDMILRLFICEGQVANNDLRCYLLFCKQYDLAVLLSAAALYSLASDGDAEVLLVVKNKRLGYFCGLLVHCRSSRGVQILLAAVVVDPYLLRVRCGLLLQKVGESSNNAR